MIHDGVVEVKHNAAGFAAQQSKQARLKTLSLKEQDIVARKLAKESKELADAPRIKADGRLYPFGFKVGQVLQHAVAACSYFKTLNEEKNFHTSDGTEISTKCVAKFYHKAFLTTNVSLVAPPIALFNRHFVKTGSIRPDVTKIFKKAFENVRIATTKILPR
ncbi:MAG TPA: hypothetical protein VKF36_10295 [Syntrophorhabdales bacterium]|nr:hypothetical protein [Syntrophorhabdales bacterium]